MPSENRRKIAFSCAFPFAAFVFLSATGIIESQSLSVRLTQLAFLSGSIRCHTISDALALYRSEGFVEEGRLRESVRLMDGADGYDSLVVMSMLDREYRARKALGDELG